MQKKSPSSLIPIRLVIFDVDDTLIYAENDETVTEMNKKFTIITPDRVVDNPQRVQVLVEHVRELLLHLNDLGITLALASMGPEWQIRGFFKAFAIDQLFDWEIGSYDRRDKGEKVELIIDHYNDRLASQTSFNDATLSNRWLQREQVVFVDDNANYLGRVQAYLPGVNTLFAHYRTPNGALNFFRDLKEEVNIVLPLPPSFSWEKLEID
jgi:HAD superfamily phosphatase (TIGR01681 family)